MSHKKFGLYRGVNKMKTMPSDRQDCVVTINDDHELKSPAFYCEITNGYVCENKRIDDKIDKF